MRDFFKEVYEETLRDKFNVVLFAFVGVMLSKLLVSTMNLGWPSIVEFLFVLVSGVGLGIVGGFVMVGIMLFVVRIIEVLLNLNK